MLNKVDNPHYIVKNRIGVPIILITIVIAYVLPYYLSDVWNKIDDVRSNNIVYNIQETERLYM